MSKLYKSFNRNGDAVMVTIPGSDSVPPPGLVIQDRIMALEAAMVHLEKAESLVAEAVAGSDRELNVEAYLVRSIAGCRDDANPHNTSCQKLIDEMLAPPHERCGHEWFESEEERMAWLAGDL